MHEPVSICVVGQADSDLEIMKLIRETFERSGRPLRVDTGRDCYK